MSKKQAKKWEKDAGTVAGHRAAEWVHNYVVLGPCDYVDIFKAPDLDTAFKVAAIVRSFGHADTEVWTATEWKSFKDMIRHLPSGERAARKAEAITG